MLLASQFGLASIWPLLAECWMRMHWLPEKPSDIVLN